MRDTASIRNALISLASTGSSSGLRALTSRGLQIDSSSVIWCAPHVAGAACRRVRNICTTAGWETPPESELPAHWQFSQERTQRVYFEHAAESACAMTVASAWRCARAAVPRSLMFPDQASTPVIPNQACNPSGGECEQPSRCCQLVSDGWLAARGHGRGPGGHGRLGGPGGRRRSRRSRPSRRSPRSRRSRRPWPPTALR